MRESLKGQGEIEDCFCDGGKPHVQKPLVFAVEGKRHVIPLQANTLQDLFKVCRAFATHRPDDALQRTELRGRLAALLETVHLAADRTFRMLQTCQAGEALSMTQVKNAQDELSQLHRLDPVETAARLQECQTAQKRALDAQAQRAGWQKQITELTRGL